MLFAAIPIVFGEVRGWPPVTAALPNLATLVSVRTQYPYGPANGWLPKGWCSVSCSDQLHLLRTVLRQIPRHPQQRCQTRETVSIPISPLIIY